MNNVPSIFNYNNTQVRVIEKDGEPWFVAKDVATVLGYSDLAKAIRMHCKGAIILKGDKSSGLTSSPRGITIIPERDVYRLIMRSKLPSAERFEEWVVGEVLPAIRKTGSYSVPQAAPKSSAEMLVMFAQQMVEQEQRIARLCST